MFLALQRQDDLDQPGDPGRGFEMPEVRLHRTEVQRLDRRTVSRRTRCRARAPRSGSPSERAGAVRLDIADVLAARRPTARAPRANQRFLREPVRHRETAAAAVLIDRRAAHHGEDIVAVGEGVAQSLQHHHAAAFAAHVAVGGRVERLAASVGRHHPRPREHDVGGRARAVRLTPPASARSALAEPQALTRQVHRDERRRAGGVDGEARSLKAHA